MALRHDLVVAERPEARVDDALGDILEHGQDVVGLHAPTL
jgi:hypothetical protein